MMMIVELIECYLNLQESPRPDCNPLNYVHIRELQQQDSNYIKLKLDDGINDIICYKKDSNWKIALPKDIVLDTVK